MSAGLFAYPPHAAFGRVLTKKKLFEHAEASAGVRKLFAGQVDQIVWQYKLAPETINLPAVPAVPELQVFSLALKTSELNQDVLRCLDQAVKFPVIYELCAQGRVQVVAAWKRPGASAADRWVQSEYFTSPWMPAESPREQLPLALNLGGLYEQILKCLAPLPARAGETLEALMERTGQAGACRRDLEKLARSMAAEKQFNRKVEINAQLRELKAELGMLEG